MADNLDLLNKLYEVQPQLFTEEEVDTLEELSGINKINFNRNYNSSDFNLINTAQQFFNGIITGFTTFNVGQAPRNNVEAIAHSIGHLIGFVGIPIPGIGTATSILAKGFSSAFKLSGVGLKAARAVGQFKSAPMAFGDLVVRSAKNVLGKDASAAATKFLLGKGISSSTLKTGLSIGESGLRLGSASAISSWQQGTDAMMNSFLWGASYGGIFKGLGVALPTKELPSGKGWLDLTKSLKDKKGVARILASSIVTGLPSTISDDPVELQVYNYLLGTYFGGAEMSDHQKEALKFMQEAPRKKYPGVDSQIANLSLMHPEKLEGYNNLSPQAKEEVLHQVYKEFGRDVLEGVTIANTEQSIASLALGKAVEDAQIALKNNDPNTFTKVLKGRLKLKAILEAQAGSEVEMSKVLESNKDLIESGRITEADLRGQHFPEIEAKQFDIARKKLAQEAEDLITLRKTILDENLVEQEKINLLSNYSDANIRRQWAELDNYMSEDKGFGISVKNSIRELALSSYLKTLPQDTPADAPIDAPNAKVILDNVRKIADITEKHINSESPDSFNNAIKEINKELKLKIKAPTVKEPNKEYTNYRNAWLLRKELTPVNQAIIDVRGDDYKTIKINPGDNYLDGTESTILKSRPFVKEILDKTYGDVDYTIITSMRTNVKRGRKTVTEDRKLSGTKGVDDTKIRYLAFKEGNHILYGIKDKGQLIRIKSLVTGEEAYKILKEFKKYFPNIGKDLVKSVSKASKNLKVPIKEVEAMVVSEFANNIKINLSMHRMNLKEYAQALRKGIVFNDPIKANKRSSLLNNGFIRWEKESFSHIEDAKTGLNITITNEVNKNGLSKVEGKEGIKYYELKDGKPIEVDEITGYDGVFNLRDDIFEAAANGGGQDIRAGGMKGTLVHTSPETSLVLGKFLYHKASSSMSKAMKEKQLHGVLNTTSAKLAGKINIVDSQYTADGRFRFFESGTTKEILTEKLIETGLGEVIDLETLADPSADKQTPSKKSSDTKQGAKSRAKLKKPIQTYTSPEKVPPAASNELKRYKFKLPHDAFTVTSAGEHTEAQLKEQKIRTQAQILIDPSMPNARAFFTQLSDNAFSGDKKTNDHYKQFKDDPKFSPENIDIDKLSITNKFEILFSGKDTPLFRKLIANYVDKFSKDPLGEEGESIYSDSSEYYRRSLSKELSNAQRLLENWNFSKSLMFSSPLQSYALKAISGKMLSELRNPKWKHSWVSKMRGYREDLQLRYDLNPGETLIDKLLEDKEIPWIDGKTKTIGDAWREYEKASPKEKKKIEPYLEIMVQRVPTSFASGIRILKIKGLTGDDGTGMVIHPEDMKAMDGADLDGDSLTAYAGIPQNVKDEYKKRANDQYKYYTKNGKEVSPNYKGKKFKIFDNPKENNPFVDEKRIMRDKSILSVLDTGTLMEVNRNAYQGVSLLGVGVNYFKAAIPLLDKYPELWKYAKEFDRMRGSLLNGAADSADGVPLTSPEESKSIINKWIADKMIKTGYSRTETSALKTVEDEIKHFSELDNAINGKRYGKSLNIQEAIELAQKELAEGESPINPFFQIAKRMSDIQIKDLAPVINDNIATQFSIVNKKIRADKDWMALLGRADIVLYNDFRNWDHYKKANDFNKWQIENEIKSQSVWDYISLLSVKNYIPKEWRKDNTIREMAVLVRTKAMNIKKEWRDSIFKTREIENEEQRTIAKNSIKSNIDAKASKERSELPERYRPLFDAFLLSSLRPQSATLKEFVKKGLENNVLLNKKKAERDKDLRIAKEKTNAQEKLKFRRLAKKKNDEIIDLEKEMKGQLSSQWWSTNMDTFPFEMRTVSNDVIQWIGKKYQEVVEKVNTNKLSLGEITEYAENDLLSKDLQFVRPEEKNTVISNFLDSSPELKKYAESHLIDRLKDKELYQAIESVKGFLAKNPRYINIIDQLFSGHIFELSGGNRLITATPEVASRSQFISFANELKAITKLEGSSKALRAWHFFEHPESIGRGLKYYDPGISLLKDVPTISSKGKGTSDIRIIESTYSKAHNLLSIASNSTEAASQKIDDRFLNNPLLIGLSQIDPGNVRWNVAVRYREMKRGNRKQKSGKDPAYYTEAYIEAFKKVEDKYNELSNSNKKVFIPKFGKEIAEKDLLKMINNEITKWAKERISVDLYNKDAVNEIVNKVTDEYGYIDINKAAKIMNVEFRNGNPKMRSLELLEILQHQEKLERIRLNTIEYFNSKDELNAGGEYNYKSLEEIKEKSEPYKTNKVRLYPKNKREQTIEFYAMKKAVDEGREYIFVKDLKNRAAMAYKLNQLKKSEFNKSGWMDRKPPSIPEGSFSSYYPHLEFDSKVAREFHKNMLIKNAKNNGDVNSLIDTKIKSLEEQMNENGDTIYLMEELNDMLADKPVTAESMANIHLSGGVNRFRSLENPTPGWSTDPEILAKYEKKVARTYYQGMGALVVKKYTENFKNSNAMGEATEEWANFLTTYNRDVLGLPSYLPKEWTKRGSAFRSVYYVATDQFYKDLTDKLNKKINANILGKTFGGLTKKGIATLDDKQKYRLKKLYDLEVSRKINVISRVEAKWQLLSLLSHTKTIVNNMVGGSVNTIGNAGMKHWKNALNFNYLKNNVFNNLENMDQVYRMIEDAGGIESFYKNELMLNSSYKSSTMQQFGKLVLGSIKKNSGKYNQDEITALGKRFGKTITDQAAWFMRWSEVKLRTRSWMTHYLKGREILEADFGLEPDNPWLLSFANKGVQSSQFLYNNANRPAFARTSMGKIFTRFQLFAFNSIRFRKELYKTASNSGFSPGSEEFNRLQRMMVADMFMLALGSIFPSTLFENAMAPPFSYAQDLSAFFFGDDEERRKAFFGVLPYPANIVQPLSPPASRVAFNTIKFLATGDLDQMGTNIVKWLPFGRLAVDAKRIVDSPAYLVESVSGLPLHRINRYLKNLRESE